ncbi:HOMEOBOX-LEUCINE ZIPPER PROTEIN MERISTEM L1 [Salix purpurea]|uniref:HOMEOBOX-LEUCINE ZIPPER PROTEIN MERISTEM L1 n=1 Tax=Salix purpurea TaxID=77065 RepID=A0A9Q0VRS4_SALPP|nr:HOMEOBOX-LEUCINE ZIPPER PROTEIN MERISTEM L1 [Salix purpurea]
MSESEEINQVQEISSDEEMMRPDITDVISISTDDSYSTGSDSTESDDTENMESSDEGLEEILKSAPGEELGLLLDQEINPQEDNMIQNNGYVPFNSNNYQSPQLSPRSDQVESVSSTNMPFEINDRASDLLMAVSVGSDANKTKIIEMAVPAMDELVRKALAGEPLWQHRKDCDHEILNEGEYIREFRPFDASLGELMRIIQMEDLQNFPNLYDNNASPNGTQQHQPMFQQDAENNLLQTESSRHIGFVRMDATRLVECLMDLKQWSSVFSDIVSRATILGVILGGVAGNYNETLQVMKAEFHMPTPVVNIRESQFARYCKQIEPGTWGVVDVSLDSLFPYPLVSFRRRPSGCLIMEMPGGYSKIIWVEHVEVDNKFVHRMFWPIVLPGFAFSATRWIASIVRHCEPVGNIISTSLDTATIPGNGKTSVLRLARRMMRRFYQDSSASTDNLWVRIPLYDGEDFRLMTKTIYDLNGCPSSTLVFSKSLWVPAPPNRVFDLLRRGESRNKWDLLALGSLGYAVHENMHIIKGESPESRVSIMQVMNSAPNQIEILYLQESYRHPTGSYVVYAPIDILTMGMMLGGGNPDLVSIFPSGFVIHPDGPVKNGEETRGSLLTLSFHIMDGSSSENYIPADSVNTIKTILTETADLIKTALFSDNL